MHGGYSRYYTPPPFELVGSETFTKFPGTTALPPGTVTQDTAPIAERANYYDFGVQQKLLDNTPDARGRQLLRAGAHLIDEGQFGAPIILTPVQLSLWPHRRRGVHRELLGEQFLRLRESLVPGRPRQGCGILAVQFSARLTSPTFPELHPSGSRGTCGGLGQESLTCGRERASAPTCSLVPDCATDLTLPDGSVIPNGDHTPSYTQINLGLSHDVPARPVRAADGAL